MTVRKGLFSFLLEKKNVQNRKAQVVFYSREDSLDLMVHFLHYCRHKGHLPRQELGAKGGL